MHPRPFTEDPPEDPHPSPDLPAPGKPEFLLAPGRLWRWEAPSRGATLRCLRGQLWLTQEGHAQDWVLEPRQRWRAPGNGRVVVQALGMAARFQKEDDTGHGTGPSGRAAWTQSRILP